MDSRRICGYGASYGAFAALQSAVLAPELLRCAVGYSGIYDLALMKSEAAHPRQARQPRTHRACRAHEAALEKAGASPGWLVEPLEAHGFCGEGARERMFTQLVSFLHENTR